MRAPGWIPASTPAPVDGSSSTARSSVSGCNRAAQAASASPNAASPQYMKRQLAVSVTQPPRAGPNSGATIIAVVM